MTPTLRQSQITASIPRQGVVFMEDFAIYTIAWNFNQLTKKNILYVNPTLGSDAGDTEQYSCQTISNNEGRGFPSSNVFFDTTFSLYKTLRLYECTEILGTAFLD